MAVLLVGSLLFADTVQFKENNGNRTAALFGTIRVFNEVTQQWDQYMGPGFIVDIYKDDGTVIHFTASVYLGDYLVDAEQYGIPLEHIVKFVVHFKGNQYVVNYDVSVQPYVRLNIDWYKLF